MAIFRGIGGAGDSTTDATVQAVTEQATNAAASAGSAATSASQASASATSAQADAASASASAGNAEDSATSASTSAASASTSASSASTSATSATASATSASNSATTASSSASTAVAARDAAQLAETGAETAQASAELAQEAANTSALASASSASAAATSASDAAISATSSQNYANASETSALASAASAVDASNLATAAANSATSASNAASAAENAYDSFDDRYLGVKASNPTLDNDGAALLTGALYFNSTDNEMRVYTGSVWIAVVDLAGDVTVNSLTSNNDVVVKGNLEVQGTTITVDSATAQTIDLGDNDRIRLGDSDDLQVYHDGTDSYIANSTGTLKLSGNTDVTGNITVSGTVDGRDIAADGATLDTALQNVSEDTTPQLGGDLDTNGNDIKFGDNDIATFGAGDDLRIWHSGTQSYIQDQGTGNVNLLGNSVVIANYNGGQNYIRCISNDAVELYYNGFQKLATTSSGVDVTGTLVSDGLTVDGDVLFHKTTSGANKVQIDALGGNNARLTFSENNNEKYNIGFQSSGAAFTIYHTAGNSIRFLLDINGDISFYDDSGTSKDFYWDASTSRLGLGTTSPSSPLQVDRASTDGDIVTLSKDGSTVGSIGVSQGSALYIVDGSSGGIRFGSANEIIPCQNNGLRVDNTVSLGQASYRWKDLYLSEGLRADTLKFSSLAGSEYGRFDSSGNLLVGTTNVLPGFGNTSEGISLRGGSHALISRSTTSGNAVLYLNKNTSDGTIAEFRKDGATVGSIGVNSSNILQVSSASAGGLFFADNGTNKAGFANGENAFRPASDAFIDLGKSDRRFKDLYLSGGVYLGGAGSANLLDDYEEGTFTATMVPSTSGSITLNSALDTLEYIKIGKQVTVTGLLLVSSVSSPVGFINIPLPIAITGGTERSRDAAVSLKVSFVGSANCSDFIGDVLGSNARIYLGDSTSIQSDSAEQIESGTQLTIGFTYFTDA